jgi:hypothetical protein
VLEGSENFRKAAAAVVERQMQVGAADGCVGFRQTGGCDPSGRREPQHVRRAFSSWKEPILTEIDLCHACSDHSKLRMKTPGQDRSCRTVVPDGVSGYCECDSEVAAVGAMGCQHEPITCEQTCQHASLKSSRRLVPVADCVAFRRTAGCDPEGSREHMGDLNCTDTVPDGVSGYCECTEGRTAAHVECAHAGLRCADVCSDLLEITLHVDAEGGQIRGRVVFGKLEDAGAAVGRTFRRMGLSGSQVRPFRFQFWLIFTYVTSVFVKKY